MSVTFDQIMACHPKKRRMFDALAADMRNIVPFIGAGLCMPPYKPWRETLLDFAGQDGVPAFTAEIQALLDRGLYEEAASALLARRGQSHFNDDFVRAFDPKKLIGATLSDAMLLLPSLFNGAAVTTNFDRTLETAYDRQRDPFRELCVPRRDDYSVIRDRVMVENAHYLIKLHGDIENYRSRVLTAEEYADLYGDIGKDAKAGALKPFPRLLRDLLSAKRFLFLGSSLASDRTVKVLQLLSGQGDVKHYAFLPLPDVTRAPDGAGGTTRIDPATKDKRDAQRKREHDLSELGIFPVWYPCGRHEAVAVLLEELRQECLKRGIPLPRRSGDAEGTPNPHPHGFFGREAFVGEVLAGLEAHPTVCLYGAPGIGKSEVCEEVFLRYRSAHRETRPLAVYLQGAYGFGGLLSKLGQALEIAPDRITEDAVRNVLAQSLPSQPTLLYLDNFEDVIASPEGEAPAETDRQAFSFLRWAETLPGLRVLLSCRKRVPGAFLWLEVNPLPPGDAWSLFQEVWNAQGGETAKLAGRGETDAKRLLQELDYHPLSIVLLASQGAEVASVHALLEAWRRSRTAEVELSPTAHNANHVSLNAAIQTSYLQIGNDPVALSIWGVCSLLPGAVRGDVLAKLFPEEEALRAAIRRLNRLNLLGCAEEQEDGSTQYRVLSPIKRQIFACVPADQPGSEANAQALLCAFYAPLLESAQPGREGWDQARDTVLTLLDDILFMENALVEQGQWDTLWPIHNGMLNYYQFRLTESLEILSAINKRDHKSDDRAHRLSAAHTKLIMGDLHGRLGQVDDAFTQYLEVDEQCRSELDNLGRANVLLSMVDLHIRLGKFDEAFARYREVERIYLIEKDNLGRANALMSMGDLQVRLGQVDDAHALYREANNLYLSEQNNIGRANALRSMGDLHVLLGQVDDAHALYREAEQLYLSEKDNLGRANVLKSIVDLQVQLGQVDDALALYKEAEKLYLSEQDNLGRANVLKSTGDLKVQLGQIDDVLALYREAEMLYLSEQDNLGRANVLMSMGDLQLRLGQIDDALALYREAEKLYLSEQNTLGRANVLQALGDLYQKIESWQEARDQYEQALPLYRSLKISVGIGYTLAKLCVVYSILARKTKLRATVKQAEVYLAGEPDIKAKDYLTERLVKAKKVLMLLK